MSLKGVGDGGSNPASWIETAGHDVAEKDKFTAFSSGPCYRFLAPGTLSRCPHMFALAISPFFKRCI